MKEKKYERFWLMQILVFGAIFIVALILAGYWFAVRPYYVRRDCNTSAVSIVTTQWDAQYGSTAFNNGYPVVYSACIHQHGL